MQKCFVAIREDTPGNARRERFVAGRAEAEAWYRGTGRGAPPTPAECTAQLRRHMPELLGPYERACALVGDDDLAAQIPGPAPRFGRPAAPVPPAPRIGEHTEQILGKLGLDDAERSRLLSAGVIGL